MKIALVHKRYTTQGGTEGYITELSQKLVETGHEVHIFCNRWENIQDDRIIFHKVPIVPLGDFLKIWSFLYFSSRKLKKIDFDVIQGFGRTIRQDIFKADGGCHKVYRQKVLKSQKSSPIRFFKIYNPGEWSKLYVEKKQFSRENYKKIIAVSEKVRDEIVRNYEVPPQDIVVIYNSVDSERFNPRNRKLYKEQVRRRHGLGLNDLVILFVGTGFARKGLRFLMEAFSSVENPSRELRLLVVGDDQNISSYRTFAKDYRVAGRVIFAGPRYDVDKYYAASDVFILPSLYEPFGKVCLEAMASGLPVIISKASGAAELIADGVNGLLLNNPRDPEEIAGKLRILLNRQVRDSLGSKASQTAKRYTLDENAKQTLEVYEEVLKHKRVIF